MAKDTARGRAKLAAKQAAIQANANGYPLSVHQRTDKVSVKTKKKVANKVQFLQKVQESAASTSRRKTKTAKRKSQPKTPLNDLAGLNQALQDLMPEVERQVEIKAKAKLNTPKFKRSAARNQLQMHEEEHMAAVLKAAEFQANPIKALVTHLQLAMGPVPEPKPASHRSQRRKRS